MKWIAFCMFMHVCSFSYIYASNLDKEAASQEADGNDSDHSSSGSTPPETPASASPKSSGGAMNLPAAKRGTLSDGLGGAVPVQPKHTHNSSMSSIPEQGNITPVREESRGSGVAASPRGGSSNMPRASVMPSSQATHSERGSEKTELIFTADFGETLAQQEINLQAKQRAVQDRETNVHNGALALKKATELSLGRHVATQARDNPKELAEFLVSNIKPGQWHVMLPVIMEAATTEVAPGSTTKKVPRILTPAEMATLVGIYYNSGVVVSKNYFSALQGGRGSTNDEDVVFMNPKDVLRYAQSPDGAKQDTPFFNMPPPSQKAGKKWWNCC